MYPLFETILILRGKIQLLEYHNKRCNASRKSLFAATIKINLADYINVPSIYKNQNIKCKVIYTRNILSIEYQNYIIRQIKSIKMIYDNNIDYSHKSTDRSALHHLFSQRDDADEILIIKNNLVSDCNFYNVAFYDGQQWYSPKSALLAGSRRQYLVDTNKIISIDITADDIHSYQKISLFNALTPFASIELSIHNIT